MARHLSLLAGGADEARRSRVDASGFEGEIRGARGFAPAPRAVLSELFAVHPRDAGWAGFVLARQAPAGPVLWVQERMAIIESGRVHPPGLAIPDLIHVTARDARAALWAMEEGIRCAALSLVIGELWGDPASLDFTATRRLAVAAERSGVAAVLIRLGGHPNLSGARMRWRLESAPSLPNPLDPRAPGEPSWRAELFRSRFGPIGQWTVSAGADGDEAAETAHPQHRLAAAGDRPDGAGPPARLSA